MIKITKVDKNFSFLEKPFMGKRGFTLVELLISISIIAILSVVLSISFSNAQKNGRDQRRISDLKAIQNAAEQYFLLNGSYPTSVKFTAGSSWTVGTQTVLERYPIDPKNTPTYVYLFYSNPNMPYCVCAKMENPVKNSNAENNNCSFLNIGDYFCVKNQQ